MVDSYHLPTVVHMELSMAEIIEAAQATSSIQDLKGAEEPKKKPKRARKTATEAAKTTPAQEANANSGSSGSPTAQESAETKSAHDTRARNTRDGNTRDGGDEPWYVRSVQKSLQRMASESKPVRKQKINLKTRHAQEMFKRGSVLWSETVITLSVTMRNFKPEEQCLVVDAEVDRIMKEPADFIKAEADRLNALADSNGVDLSDTTDVEYTNPAQYEMLITAPRERRFYDLLQEFDKLCICMDALWMSSLVGDRARSKSAYDVKRSLVRALYQARNLVFRAQASSDRNGIHNIRDPRSTNAANEAKATPENSTAKNSVAPPAQATEEVLAIA